nr:Chain I, Karyogamy protein KAR9 [Saccharomyces cerevisiae]5N74_J Chain J, Karyogamy protein KAR9 [Saccharomyces cerevisiae]5N74_K Chain K, Karyogamy protein KAR9 [Saccharomyces cerevisiae]5N74_L Chain L, Karyogamy protein KAR9 [Saccharomyces cerevisiae]5N74_M Chain M, Karyogamy protein KAR9 [Saccharomyces cerevisiae]5N74_N Chain N, Karyogamy protein KAR9 [Saccharomyces cerevisiae]5N74_O Chain O, Karyogamy protein KAR9 [Saccharomyces cerevisiae]5N74_P Chain P, Karyogamy protein KAR9 [Sacch
GSTRRRTRLRPPTPLSQLLSP